ncbi:MAG: recombination protein RecR [Bacilli bacterium]|nr:recombination protein RecR [Bacilli bacterium]MBO7536637.1 recombination protein RecR [Bacilli bacterium]
MKYPDSLDKLIKSFSKYPGIGPKTAERLAFYTITKMNKDDCIDFADNLKEAINNIKECEICGLITDKDICNICSDDSRTNELMIVEGSRDVIAFEQVGSFKGKYHVLGGVISPLNGVGPDDLNINKLISRIKAENITDVIIALSANIPSETTALYLKSILEDMNVNVYRIGYGLPVGANIEYLDEITLAKALEGKKKM